MSIRLRSRAEWRAEIWIMLRAGFKHVINPVLGGNLRTIVEKALAWTAEGLDLQIYSMLSQFWDLKGDMLDRAVAEIPIDPRKPANKARGSVLFKIPSTDEPEERTIKAGTLVSSSATGVMSQTLVETSAYSDVIIQCEALTTGANGNAAIGEIDTLLSPVNGVSGVTNPTPFTDGADKESDAALNDRRKKFFTGMSKGTVASLEGAALAVPGVMFAGVAEHYPAPGEATLTACDGTGGASAELLAAIETNVETGGPTVAPGYRTAGGRIHYSRPTRYLFISTMRAIMGDGYKLADYLDAIKAAHVAYLASLGLGATLVLTKVKSALRTAVEQLDAISAITAEIIMMPVIIPVEITGVGGDPWTSGVLEWNYSMVSLRWAGGAWTNVGDSPTRLYDAARTSYLDISCEPYVTGSRWPRYSLSETLTRTALGEATKFEKNEFVKAGPTTILPTIVGGVIV